MALLPGGDFDIHTIFKFSSQLLTHSSLYPRSFFPDSSYSFSFLGVESVAACPFPRWLPPFPLPRPLPRPPPRLEGVWAEERLASLFSRPSLTPSKRAFSSWFSRSLASSFGAGLDFFAEEGPLALDPFLFQLSLRIRSYRSLSASWCL